MTIAELKKNNLLLLECISGSKAYGLDTPASDTDLKGVFFLPRSSFYGIDYVSQVSNEKNDEVYYELGRFVELLIKNNPNLLELLATPDDCILYRHPVMDQLSIDMFLSKLCKETFAGYAITQIKKARGYKKKIVNPVDKERKSVLDFCFILNNAGSIPLTTWLKQQGIGQEQCGLSSIPHIKGMYALYYDVGHHAGYRGIVSSEAADDVSLSSIPKEAGHPVYMYFNKEAYSTYCKDYREYWQWVEKRNEDRFLGNMQHGKGYDAKNMMHTIRLLQVAKEIGSTGRLQVKRPNRDELLAIKSGAYAYEQLLQMADTLFEEVETAFANSTLPEAPDSTIAEAILVNMREMLYHT
jgi:Predicted nucleotidyltransferase